MSYGKDILDAYLNQLLQFPCSKDIEITIIRDEDKDKYNNNMKFINENPGIGRIITKDDALKIKSMNPRGKYIKK
mgnify:CR=1 FL=1